MGTLLLVFLCASNVWLGHPAPQNSSSEQLPGPNDQDDFQMVDLCNSVSDQGKKESCAKCLLEVAYPEKDTDEVVKCTEHLAEKVASCVKKVAESKEEDKKYGQCNTVGSQQTLMEDSPENSQSEPEDDVNEETVQEEVSEKTEETAQPDEPNNTTDAGNHQVECWSEYGSMAATDLLLKRLEESDPVGFHKVMTVIESCVNVSTVSETLDVPEVDAMEENKETKVPSGSGKVNKENTSKAPERKDGKNDKKAQGSPSTPASAKGGKKSRRKREEAATSPPVDPSVPNANITECLVTALMENEEAFSIIKTFLLHAEIPVPSPVVKVLIAGLEAKTV